jgi:hypothetical protein
MVLAADEELPVIVDDRLGQGREGSVTARMEEDGMPAEAIGEAGDGGLCAVERAGDLPVARAGGEARGDENEQLGSLEVVGGRERLA